MKTVMKRGLGVLLSMLMIVAILPQITIKAKAESGVDDFVTRCYKVALQRDPDKGGFDFWKAKITNGELVGSTVVYEFIFSKEYEGQNRSDKEFVNDLYTMFMGRAADQGGYDYWCGQMASGMTRKEVFAGFANSKEFYELCYKYGITSGFFTNDYEVGRVNNVNLFVERLYKTCLGRLGDQEGQAYWVEGMLKGELTGIGCAANYIKSKEYEALGLTDEQYVENLYIGFMGRQYDEGGKANWLGHLTNKTKTRDQVFEGFANSPEFQGICAGYGIESGSYTATDIAKPDSHHKANAAKTETYYDENSNVLSYCEYDSSDNKIKDIEYEDGKITRWHEKEYDSNGNITKSIYFDSDGNAKYIYEYEYDSNGNETKSIERNPDGSIDCYSDIKYDFDSHGNIIKKTWISSDGSTSAHTYVYAYDNKGNKVKCVEYWNGVISEIKEYDLYGNVIKEYDYIDGELFGSFENVYDSNGNCIKQIQYDIEDGTIEHSTEYEYDSNGNEIEVRWLNSNGEVYTWFNYYYDGKGNITKSIRTQFNNVGSYCDHYYDSKGRLITIKCYFFNNDYGIEKLLYVIEYKYL